MSEFDFDLFVIGAGSGGVRAARKAATEGIKVGIAEEKALGGTCVNVGCVPKKLMVYASSYPQQVKNAQGYGWDASIGEFDWPAFIEKKNAEILRLNGIYGNLLDNSGVTLFKQRAHLIEPNVVKVGDKRIRAKRILIAVGGQPFVPEFTGNDLCITSDDVFYLPTQPKDLLIVGAGYIAVEFAGVFNGMGTNVDILSRKNTILNEFDRSTVDFLTQQMQEQGINILFENGIERVIEKDGKKQVTFKDGQIKSYDEILLATGRTTAVDNLGLKDLGIELTKTRAIQVDENYQTNIKDIYAIGDVIGKVQLTPVAIKEAMGLIGYWYQGATSAKIDYNNIPTAVFCQPNIGTVGMTQEQAEKENDIQVYESNFRPMSNTISGDTSRMYMKLIVEKQSQKVLGWHMCGQDAGEMLQGFAVAIKMGATKHDFDSVIGIHPTAAEEWVTLN
ncbi:glutathione-disulfide reductase [Marinicellulosiphila megalodicopiae]|uniref:glutathione-disulfide reductase n=1 Tax=Marinicellulosiphila megalodicopiae TaxID=2724896 RepID=UPI003BB202E2